MNWFVVQPHQPVARHGGHRIGPPIVAAKLNLIDSGSPNLNDSAHVPANQPMLGQIFKQCHNGMWHKFAHDHYHS